MKNKLEAYYNKMRFNPHPFRTYILVYTGIFIVLSLLVFAPFWVNGKSLVWNADGFIQHYTALRYLGTWLRGIIGNLFLDHTLSIPTWSFSLGTGSDIITTLNYYGFSDPLNLLSVFVPERFTEHLYGFLILLRLYLSGLFFSCFCRKMEKGRWGTLLGCLAYVFCGFVLFAGVRHPFFLTPMVYFPLALLGAERIFRKEGLGLFSIAVCLSGICNLYFTYTLCIFIVIYAVVRYFNQRENKSFKDFIQTVAKFLFSGFTGFLMGAVVLIPVVLIYLGSSRISVDRAIPLFYDSIFYENFISSAMNPAHIGNWTNFGFVPLSIISSVILFIKKKQNKEIKIFFILSLIFLLLPICGHILNAFSYSSNRWIWAFSFVVAFSLTTVFPEILALNKKEKVVLTSILIGYFVLVLVLSHGKNVATLEQFSILFLSLFLLFVPVSGIYKKILLSGLCVISILINSFFMYSYQYTDYVSEFIDNGNVSERYAESISRILKNKLNSGTSRYALRLSAATTTNESLMADTKNTAFYWSMTDSKVAEYLREIKANVYTDYCYTNLESRTMVDALFGVKQYISASKNDMLPYGYTYSQEVTGAVDSDTTTVGKKTYYLFENEYALPLGYIYSAYLTRSEYENLSATERQEAMIQNVLLEKDIDGYEKNTFSLTSAELDYEITKFSGVTETDEGFFVTRSNGSIILEFDETAECELYLELNGFDAEGYTAKELYQKYPDDSLEWEAYEKYEQNKLIYQDRFAAEQSSFIIKATSGKYSNSYDFRTNKAQFYDGRDSVMFNLGYMEEGRSSITITFPSAGMYSFESFNVIAQPMKLYTEAIAQRGEDVMENVRIGTNSLSGTIDLDEPKILCLSVPYSKGWTATVDGKETELLQANTWSMALDLDAGEHTIELHYSTPGLRIGIYASIIGFGIFAATQVIIRRRRKVTK